MRYRVKKGWVAVILFVTLGVAYYFALPAEIFSDPYSTVIEDRHGRLLGARIADDGQWRFPESDAVPERFKAALLGFEDRYFYWHPGFNPISMAKALWHNIRTDGPRRGGSTITMQVIRMSRKGRARRVVEKLVETILATRLEMRLSKDDILALYASHAPFGGNVVGLEAASWRYFSRPPHELTWAESATLAVLPNAPSLIFPGKNQELLKRKRDQLLTWLYHAGVFDKMTLDLSIAEPLPGRPYPLPSKSLHLLNRVVATSKGQRVVTTIDTHLQHMADAIVNEYARQNLANEIHNAAAIIMEVASGEVLAYIGNTRPTGSADHGHHVDIIPSARSTGSILKPFLYALMMQEGTLLPNTLVPDIPTQIAGYSPKNYFLTYDGAVPARRSLSRSLNVPSVRMLQSYGVEKFHHYLKEMGLSTLIYPPGHYGLSLILGGAEGRLWDITGMYASMSRVLRHATNGETDAQAMYWPPRFQQQQNNRVLAHNHHSVLEAAAIWLTYEALLEVNRPDAESGWALFSSQGRVAWKTGTSFGGRDAWAVGTTKDYVIGVWVGNATGEGRSGLTGLGQAAPVMFDLFNLLPGGDWFEKPFVDIAHVAICRNSGHRAGRYCIEADTLPIHRRGLESVACPYHQLIHLDQSGRYRVDSRCEDPRHIRQEAWFVLPPAMEWFYKSRHSRYKPLPPVRSDCLAAGDIQEMELMYPGEGVSVFIPRELDGSKGVAVFEVAHRNPMSRLYWHLNDSYLGQTTHVHRMALSPDAGFHKLVVIDERGQELERVFEVVR